MKFVIRNPALYSEPKGQTPPPWWIRGLLILTCTGVSFAHGSNDGQKGMGLIMLILIGTVPTAYALNRSLPASHIVEFTRTSAAAIKVVQAKEAGHQMLGNPRPAVSSYITYHGDKNFKPAEGTYVALAKLMEEISSEIKEYGAISKIPFAAVGNTRNDIYLASEALRFLSKDEGSELTEGEKKTLGEYKPRSTRRRSSSRPG